MSKDSKIFVCMIKREFAIHMARKNEWLSVLLLYSIIISLFPIALGTWTKDNLSFAPIIIWIAALIATALAQETLLRTDFILGVFDQMIINHHAISILLLAKILAHWLIYAVPIVLLTPVFAVSFGLSALSVTVISLSLFLGTLFLSLVAAIGAAITIQLARGGIFLAMIILPLYVPILSLGCDIGILSLHDEISKGHFAMLAAMVIIALCGVPYATAAAIRVSME